MATDGCGVAPTTGGPGWNHKDPGRDTVRADGEAQNAAACDQGPRAASGIFLRPGQSSPRPGASGRARAGHPQLGGPGGCTPHGELGGAPSSAVYSSHRSAAEASRAFRLGNRSRGAAAHAGRGTRYACGAKRALQLVQPPMRKLAGQVAVSCLAAGALVGPSRDKQLRASAACSFARGRPAGAWARVYRQGGLAGRCCRQGRRPAPRVASEGAPQEDLAPVLKQARSESMPDVRLGQLSSSKLGLGSCADSPKGAEAAAEVLAEGR